MALNNRKQRYNSQSSALYFEQKPQYINTANKKKPAKVKIISNAEPWVVSREVNEFIEDKWVINLQFSTAYKGATGVVIYTVFIYYTERASNVPQSNLN